MNKVLVVSLALLGFAYGYDFADEFFNQLLSKEYEDYTSEETLLHHRARRDNDIAKCSHKYKFCCANDLMSKLHDKYRDVKRECFKEVTGKEFGGGPPFTCEELEKRKTEMTCIAQCAGKKKGVLDGDGNIIEEEIMKLVKEHMSALEWFQPHLEDAVQKCLAQAKEAAEKREEGACNPADIKFTYCLFKEIQLGCPTDQIKDQAKCDAVRESLKKHEFPPVHTK